MFAMLVVLCSTTLPLVQVSLTAVPAPAEFVTVSWPKPVVPLVEPTKPMWFLLSAKSVMVSLPLLASLYQKVLVSGALPLVSESLPTPP